LPVYTDYFVICQDIYSFLLSASEGCILRSNSIEEAGGLQASPQLDDFRAFLRTAEGPIPDASALLTSA
jgi:hypothetical protein